ncbi:MAG: hypothetical protein LC100_14910 [Chitinophagales bacterium]|nr:hypothetical protein [Chitinophagales bacterium]
MKFVTPLVLVATLSFAASAQAQGTEELCHRSAENIVRMKQLMKIDPLFLPSALEDNSKSKSKQVVKDLVRERLFYAYNRKDMPDKDVWQLAFIDCLAKY